MEIIIAENTGLCYGVKRALRIAKETQTKKPEKAYTLGDLIHNPQVIKDLEKYGIHSINDINKIKKGSVIIRSHGVSPHIYDLLQKKNIDIIDATCPIVQKIQKLVSSLSEREEEIIIVGNKEHPEIKGLIGYSQGKGIIIENEVQARKLPFKRKRAVLVQSTQNIHLFQHIVDILSTKTKELDIHNTICQSTQTRQKSTSELASKVDVLFIIGGKNSSNTHTLFRISKKVLTNTYFIEKANQITPEMLNGARKIGLSGGASTPPKAIKEAVIKIKSSIKYQFHRENKFQCLN